MSATHNITLDITKQRLRLDQSVHVRVGDASSQIVTCALTKDGAAYTPPSGSTAKIEVLKSDNTWSVSNATISGSNVSATLPTQAISAPGECKRAYFRLISGSAEDTTEDFYLAVYANATDEAIESRPYADQFEELLEASDEELSKAIAYAKGVGDMGDTPIDAVVGFEMGTFNWEGEATPSTTVARTNDYIDLSKIGSITFEPSSGYRFLTKWYVADGTCVHSVVDGDYTKTEKLTYTREMFGNLTAMRFSVSKTDGSAMTLDEVGNVNATFESVVGHEAGKVDVVNANNSDEMTWEIGNINSSGADSESTTRIRSSKLYVGKGTYVSIGHPGYYMVFYYDSEMNYKSHTDWSRYPIIIQEGCYIRVLIQESGQPEYTEETMQDVVSRITIYRRDADYKNLIDAIVSRNNLNNTVFSSSDFCHFEQAAGGIWFKPGTKLNFRGGLNTQFSWSQVASDIKQTSPLGIENSIYIPSGSAFVLDVPESDFAIVTYKNFDDGKHIPILWVLGRSNTPTVIGGVGQHLFDEWLLHARTNKNGEYVGEKLTEHAAHIGDTKEQESFIFFTDTHIVGFSDNMVEQQETLDRFLSTVRQYEENSAVNFVMCGGDWLNNGDTRDVAKAKLGIARGCCRRFSRYYSIVGNHDTNYQGTGDNVTLTVDEVHAAFYDGSQDKNYYSFDTEATRFYVLDTWIGGALTDYTNEQLAWIAEELLVDKQHSAIGMHIWWINPSATSPVPMAQELSRIISAYNSRGTVSFGGETYDYSECSGKVEFIATGHTHADMTDSVDGVPVFATNQFRKSNTPTFELVVADYETRKLYLTRVGYGESRELDLRAV